MTRPAQPRPYPGDVSAQPTLPRPPFQRTFPGGLDGEAIIRSATLVLRVPIAAGELSVDGLPPGEYHMLAVLTGAGGVHYEDSDFKVEAYW